jgi:hypothetical protein
MIKSVHIYITQHAKKLGTETTENWYSHIPTSVCKYEDITVLWNEGYKQIERFWQKARHNN